MDGSDFDELDFFRRIRDSGARVLLIGRRALAVLGIPVLTADYDFWAHPADLELLNAAVVPLGFVPTRTPDQARQAGKYALQNDEHVDVLLARAMDLPGGQPLVFDQVWERRKHLALSPSVLVATPSIDDLIATKRCAGRPKDLEDIGLLEALAREENT